MKKKFKKVKLIITFFMLGLFIFLSLLPAQAKQNIQDFIGINYDSIISAGSFNPEDTRPIGYEFLDDGKVVHIWNIHDDYYFNKTSGIQFTNHFQDYWTRNIFCLGYYSGEEWIKIKCADELENFNRNIQTDNETYVNATLWKDFTYGSYDVRLGVQYHLGLNDENLSITIYGKNLGIDIPFDLGFAWKVTDWDIPLSESDDYLEINNTGYPIKGNYNLLFKNLDETYFKGRDTTYHFGGEFLRVDWKENLNYAVKMYGNGTQEDFYVALLINAGHFNPQQEKSTTFYWIDALVVGTNVGFVSVAPTTNPSGSVLAIDYYALGLKVVSPASATKVVEIGWYCDNPTEASDYDVGIYTHDVGNNEPEDVVGSLSTNNAKGTTSGWKSVTGLNITISPSTIYWICAQLDNTATETKTNYAVGDNYFIRDWVASSLPDPTWNIGGIVSDENRFLSVYAVYEMECNSSTGTHTCIFESGEILADIKISDEISSSINYDSGTIFKWDIDALNDLSGVEINDAFLEVYVATKTGTPDDDMRIWYIQNQNLNESSTAAEIEAMSVYNNTLNATAWTGASAGSRHNLTITKFVQEACSREENLTIRMEDDDYQLSDVESKWDATTYTQIGRFQLFADNNWKISTKEETNVSRRPKLFINYTITAGDFDAPNVNLLTPADNSETNSFVNTFNCSASDNINLTNVTLYGNWSNIWHSTETNSSGLNDTNYSFIFDISTDWQEQDDNFDIFGDGCGSGFDLTSNDSHIFIVDFDDDWVYCYTLAGVYASGCDINISEKADSSRGITMDSNYFYFTDYLDDNITTLLPNGTFVTTCDISSSGSDFPKGITIDPNGDFWVVDQTDDFVYHFNSTCVNQTDGFAITDLTTPSGAGITTDGTNFWIVYDTDNTIKCFNASGTYNSSLSFSTASFGATGIAGIASDKETTSGTITNFYITDTGDNDVYHLESTLNGNYDWNCYACDNSSNCAFADANYALNVSVSTDVTLTAQSPVNDSYNATTGNVNFTAYINSTFSISSATLHIQKYYGGWYLNDVYNITKLVSPTNNANNSLVVNLTNGWYRWKINATNSQGATNSTGWQNYKTGKGKVYIHHAIHAEPRNMDSTTFNQVLTLTDFDEGGTIDDVFDTTHRYKYNDSYGNPNTYIWKLRMDQGICESTTGCNSIIDEFLNDEWNYTSNDNIDGNISYWNDSLGWHMHIMEWFNWTDYNLGNAGPWQPAEYWNQIMTMNGTIYREETDIQTAEKMLSIFIIDSTFYPLSSCVGWLGVSTQISNWYSEKVPFMYDNNYASSAGTDTTEPIDNVCNWTTAPHEMYNPSPLDYLISGNNSNYIMQCSPGGLDDHEGQWQKINNSFWLANQGVDNIICHYSHTYYSNSLIQDVNDLHECINESKWGTNCPNGDDMATLYPEVEYIYTDGKTMVQEVMEKTDTTNPTITVNKVGDIITITSNENLWNPPLTALKDYTGNYTLCNITETDTNEWECDISGLGIGRIRATGIDTSFNSGYSDLLIQEVIITSPTETNPITSATYLQNITINFTMRNETGYFTSNVEWLNATVGTTLAPNISNLHYAGSNIWQINVSIPDLSGSQDLTIWANHSSTGPLTDTESDAVVYSCWHKDATGLLHIPIGCLFKKAIGELFSISYLSLIKSSIWGSMAQL